MKFIQMETSIVVSIVKVKHMGKEFILGRMEKFMTENGSME